MIELLVQNPNGAGALKMRIYPPALNLKEDSMQAMVELVNTQEVLVNRQIAYITGQELKDYLKGEVTEQTLIKLITDRLGYKVW